MDVAIQYGGDTRAIVDLALLNNISATDEIAPGSKLIVPDVALNTQVVNYLARKNKVPATNMDFTIHQKLEGIGYWRIALDFIVQ